MVHGAPWELPAGVVEHGETTEQAAAREMLEETGWRAGTLHPLMTFEPFSALSDARYHVYWADGAEYVGRPQDDFESDRRGWVALDRVPDLIGNGEIHNASTIAAPLVLHHMRVR